MGGCSLHLINRNHSNTFLLINMQKQNLLCYVMWNLFTVGKQNIAQNKTLWQGLFVLI